MAKKAVGESVFAILAACAALPFCVRASTIVVTSPADSGAGTLRQSVAEASAGDTIRFAPGIERIVLTSGEILVGKDLEIHGPQATSPGDQLVIASSGSSRLLHVTGPVNGVMPVVVIGDLALTGGVVTGGSGGAILNEGNLSLLRCSLYGNAARSSGGGGNGGAVANTGILRIEACTLYGNRAVGEAGGGNGGAIYNGWGGTQPLVPRINLVNSTVSGNEAAGSGSGGSARTAPSLRALEDKTGLGGGVFNDSLPTYGAWGVEAIPGFITTESSTLTLNAAASGGGVGNYLLMETGESGPAEALGGTVLFESSIVSGNSSTEDGGAVDLLGDGQAYDSVIGYTVGNLGGQRNILHQDAGLLPLADNGGPTLTHALRPWSPAVNAGSKETGLLSDQTGSSRTSAGRMDCGSWEFPLLQTSLAGGLSAAFSDRDGDAVRISLAGPGEGFATALDGADAVDITLRGTTKASELEIESSGPTTIRNVFVEGRLKAFRAPNTDLLGNLTVTGSVRKVVLHDVVGTCAIDLGPTSDKGVRLEFHSVRDLALRVQGRLRSLTAESWDGRGDGAHDVIEAARIGTVLVAGWARKLRIVSSGNVNRVEVGGFDRSYVLAGTSPGLIGIADPRSDWTAYARIGEFRVTDAAADPDGCSFIDGVLAASSIGEADLGSVRPAEEGPAFGLSCDSLGKLQYTLDGESHVRKSLVAYEQSIRDGRFSVSVRSAADLGFTFGVLDDSRGDVWLPGVASMTLGYLFRQAAEDHCRFLLVPGDLSAGYMGLCMSDATCAVFDPDGSISKALSDQQYPEFLQLAAKYGYTPASSGGGPPTLCPTRGNHECYLKDDLTRDQWSTYIGQYLPQNGPSMGSAPDQNPEMDERGFTYSFRCDNALFIGIDEYAAHEDKDNGIFPPASTKVPSVFCNGWLAEQMQAFQEDPSLDHCFVFGHSPLYVVKMDTSMDATALTRAGRDDFLGGVDGMAEIYFCGHEHFYDHTVIAGTSAAGGEGIDALHQVLVGTGGAEIDRKTEADCDYSASYVRDPARQYYHNPEIPSSGDPQPYIGYNLVTVSGPDVSFQWKAWHVNNPCYLHLLPVPCGLCPWCTVDETPAVKNAWSYSVHKGS